MEIKDKIYTIRGKQVMLDRDLAELYGVDVKQLKRQVRRNSARFPDKFCFLLSKEEQQKIDSLRCQNVTLENKRGKHSKYLPYVFTEQGVAMLSTVLKSGTAINISIRIMDAFIAMRRFINQNRENEKKFQQIDQKLIEHDKYFEKVFNAIESKEIKPKQGVFFEGQVFDAHKFVSDLINTVKNISFH